MAALWTQDHEDLWDFWLHGSFMITDLFEFRSNQRRSPGQSHTSMAGTSTSQIGFEQFPAWSLLKTTPYHDTSSTVPSAL